MVKSKFRKIMVVLLSLIFTVTTVLQINIPVQAAVETKKAVVEFPLSSEMHRMKTVTLPNLYEVTDVSVDSGTVRCSVEGENVTVSVYGGSVYHLKKTVEIVVRNDIDVFSSTAKYSDDDGYSGELARVGVSSFNPLFNMYELKYSGMVTDLKHDLYKYLVTITYIENAAPEIVKVSKPAVDKRYNNKIPLECTVRDVNAGDTISVYYSVYDIKGVQVLPSITADGKEQPFVNEINLDSYNLDDGSYVLTIWATDRKGAKSNEVRVPFYLDLTPPDAPQPTANPGKDTPTNKDVQVTITFPDDAEGKKYKEGPDGTWKDYIGPINVSVNKAVYSECYDEAGNTSPVSVIEIANIDRIAPSAPQIVTSADETVASPINVKIIPGTDDKSGIDRTEYSLSGATVSDWKTYDKPFDIKNEGTTKIIARSIDKAGNISDVTEESVNIKPAVVASPSPGNIIIPVVSTGPVNPTTPTATPIKVITEPTPRNIAANPGDLSVFITSDKTTFGENDTAAFTISYRNKLKSSADSVVVKADIPQYTTILDSAGGTVKGNTIEWNIGSLAGEASGQIKYSVKVGLLDKAEVKSSNKAVITSSNIMTNTDDDESVYLFMLYSNRYESKNHKKFIIGYEDNTFRPENNITRAEVAAILVRVLDLGKEAPDKKPFSDLNEKGWDYGYICSATKYGLFEGYPDGTFKPGSYITRAELSTALARYLKFKNVDPEKIHFPDTAKHWARNYIEEIFRIKLIAGYQDGTFMPDSPIKRTETVTIIDRMLFRGPLTGADVTFKDVDKKHWAYGHITESSLDHYYTRNADGTETKVNK